MKTKWFSILKYNTFEFGQQKVSQFVLFECKYLFSIIFFYFHRSIGSQDRYHTHAFNAVSIKLWGRYNEYVCAPIDNDINKFRHFWLQPRTETFKYIPRDCFHKIGNSTGCATILLSGPWKETWTELLDSGEIKTYTWGRNE